jgi:hypothetical protein
LLKPKSKLANLTKEKFKCGRTIVANKLAFNYRQNISEITKELAMRNGEFFAYALAILLLPGQAEHKILIVRHFYRRRILILSIQLSHPSGYMTKN